MIVSCLQYLADWEAVHTYATAAWKFVQRISVSWDTKTVTNRVQVWTSTQAVVWCAWLNSTEALIVSWTPTESFAVRYDSEWSLEIVSPAWILQETWLSWETKEIVLLWGVSQWHTWLTVWAKYYVQDNWDFWETETDNFIWIAISTTQIKTILVPLHNWANISLDSSVFSWALSINDIDVQKAMETLDGLSTGGWYLRTEFLPWAQVFSTLAIIWTVWPWTTLTAWYLSAWVAPTWANIEVLIQKSTNWWASYDTIIGTMVLTAWSTYEKTVLTWTFAEWDFISAQIISVWSTVPWDDLTVIIKWT